MKKRLDVLLAERGLFESREKAQAAVMAGVVTVNGQRELKPGTKFTEAAELAVTEDVLKYVGRGGLKLEKAIDLWQIDLTGMVCMDIGASTGGFTDLMLQRGAAKVYAVDVGYGQLDWKLRNDPRVVNIERTNIRYLDPELIDEKPSFISIDVSFISLKLVLPVAAGLLKDEGQLVALIKPQFEAGRAQVGKGGIVRDESVRAEVIEKVKGYAKDYGFTVKGITESPITGTKGNVEYLMRCVTE
ncbi:MAG: TlyA family RNA methyltransferase [Clostridiales Family XIII bacterium]|nr:TlyA family RNA methyltransferase [Clostridiales Family XIII bacterium]